MARQEFKLGSGPRQNIFDPPHFVGRQIVEQDDIAGRILTNIR